MQKSYLPSFGLEVVDRVTSETLEPALGAREPSCFFVKIPAKDTQKSTYRWTPQKRGLHRFEALIVRTRYPFGLIEKGRFFRASEEIIVYPAIVPLDIHSVLGHHLGEDAQSERSGHHGDISGLRDYAEGDDARSIHWRRSAMLDRIVVRERMALSRARLTLFLDQAQPEHSSPEAELEWLQGF